MFTGSGVWVKRGCVNVFSVACGDGNIWLDPSPRASDTCLGFKDSAGSRVRSTVLTLGFVQICLRGWTVVMRAKKNSPAVSLTTRLVFLMKPNENSIFSPFVIPSRLSRLSLSLSLCAHISPPPPLAPQTDFLLKSALV
ncbi:hypothetical protein EYF80_060803 [Liparis tanakae]|uniref:Uncharacterized protein n=1 Tax=Liparis tanakae TaxID=230148 RepID=A0A4Z2EJS5_9TELE|nr:hypothetical protein EYF80_060803 [Liparis tanakae]